MSLRGREGGGGDCVRGIASPSWPARSAAMQQGEKGRSHEGRGGFGGREASVTFSLPLRAASRRAGRTEASPEGRIIMPAGRAAAAWAHLQGGHGCTQMNTDGVRSSLGASPATTGRRQSHPSRIGVHPWHPNRPRDLSTRFTPMSAERSPTSPVLADAARRPDNGSDQPIRVHLCTSVATLTNAHDGDRARDRSDNPTSQMGLHLPHRW